MSFKIYLKEPISGGEDFVTCPYYDFDETGNARCYSALPNAITEVEVLGFVPSWNIRVIIKDIKDV